MKFQKAYYLFLFLIFIPFASWYFLTGGIEYRLQSLEDLKMEKHMDQFSVFGDTTMLHRKVSFVILNGDSKLVNQMFDQFVEAPGFQVLNCDQSLSDDIEAVNFKSLDSLQCSELNKIDTLSGGRYALIDGDRNLRKVYFDDNEFKDIVRHIATVLPYVEKKLRK